MKRLLYIGSGLALLAFVAILPLTRHTASAAPAAKSEPKASKTMMPPIPPAPAVPIPFVSVCTFSHRGPDDPIVKFNQPGASHSHDFFGNVTTAANSTFDSLSAGGTTCSRAKDTAAYWVPTLMVDGQAVTPIGINAYYRTGRRDPKSIQPFPSGMKIVAGNSKATGPQSAQIVTFSCRGMDVPKQASPSVVPTCATDAGHGLAMSIHFPDCWNGSDLDSADHQSHMAYSERGVCPAGYPVPVPALTVHVKYAIAGGAGVSLSSGPAYTAHADFFNAWDQSELTKLVQNCINAQVECGARRSGAR